MPAANIHVEMQYIGGGFGSKFAADSWGVEAALLSKASGGKPVKMARVALGRGAMFGPTPNRASPD